MCGSSSDKIRTHRPCTSISSIQSNDENVPKPSDTVACDVGKMVVQQSARSQRQLAAVDSTPMSKTAIPNHPNGVVLECKTLLLHGVEGSSNVKTA